MSQRMITIEVAPETAELLRTRAAARHLSLDQYLRVLAIGGGQASIGRSHMTPDERAKRWDEWTTRHAVRTQTPVDDSRESIYTREDEAL